MKISKYLSAILLSLAVAQAWAAAVVTDLDWVTKNPIKAYPKQTVQFKVKLERDVDPGARVVMKPFPSQTVTAHVDWPVVGRTPYQARTDRNGIATFTVEVPDVKRYGKCHLFVKYFGTAGMKNSAIEGCIDVERR
jgi:hypothetical protein